MMTPSDLKSPNTVVEYHTRTKNEYFLPCFRVLPGIAQNVKQMVCWLLFTPRRELFHSHLTPLFGTLFFS